MNSELVTIVLTLIGALSSAKAWEYWQNKQKLAREKEITDTKDQNMYRDDLKKEVERLRTELIGLYEKREKELIALQKEISDLREELAIFKVRVDFLEKENSDLKTQLAEN